MKTEDEPIYAMPRIEVSNEIARSVSAAFNHGVHRTPLPIVVAYEKVFLLRVKPVLDSQGNIIGKRPA